MQLEMKSLKNNVQIVGNLGNTPELKIVNDKKLTRLSVAVNERKRYKNGEVHTRTYWHYVTVWGKLAEQVCKLSKKGTMVLISGKVKSSNYTDKSGKQRNSTEIVAKEIVINYTQAA
jgi:single-strand DNA-binding protein